jgi:hypothetical protein
MNPASKKMARVSGLTLDIVFKLPPRIFEVNNVKGIEGALNGA